MGYNLETLKAQKAQGEKFAMLTAYDATLARVIDAQGIEGILVGDSLGMVVQGQASTAVVTLADMELHTTMVRRGTQQALLMADVPIGCTINTQATLESSLRLLRAGAEMVKIEVFPELLPSLGELSRQGLAFCAHLGLRPQQVLKEGGYKIKGRVAAEAKQLLDLAARAEAAGADMLLLECVLAELATEITKQAKIPVIGIGCGAGTDAQILVTYDLLGLNPRPPRFVKDFLCSAGSIQQAIATYHAAVLDGTFPASEHAYP